MGWRFRKSFKLLPGVRINVSKRGISTTIGASPLSLNVGSRGTHATFSIPGTGLSHREKLGGQRRGGDDSPSTPEEQIPFYQPHEFGLAKQEIRSASTYELSSVGLEGLRNLLSFAAQEHRHLDIESAEAAKKVVDTTITFDNWNQGFFLKRIRKARFAQLAEEAQEAKDSTQMDVAPEIRTTFGHLCDAFSVLSTSQFIWDTLSTKRADQFRARTIAHQEIDRMPVRFRLGQSGTLQCEWNVPHLENANGGDMFIYPGFILYRVTRGSFAVIDSREITVKFEPTGFIEETVAPTDSEHVGQTWKYANKDGGPDRRFSGNYAIPIYKYGEIQMTSFTGLNEKYLVSCCPRAEAFVQAWQIFQSSLPPQPFTQNSQERALLPPIRVPEINDDTAVARGAALVAAEIRRREMVGQGNKKGNAEKLALILIGAMILFVVVLVVMYQASAPASESIASPSPSPAVTATPARRRRAR
jgi:hypothetical protein